MGDVQRWKGERVFSKIKGQNEPRRKGTGKNAGTDQ